MVGSTRLSPPLNPNPSLHFPQVCEICVTCNLFFPQFTCLLGNKQKICLIVILPNKETNRNERERERERVRERERDRDRDRDRQRQTERENNRNEMQIGFAWLLLLSLKHAISLNPFKAFRQLNPTHLKESIDTDNNTHCLLAEWLKKKLMSTMTQHYTRLREEAKQVSVKMAASAIVAGR